jgi:hypothetical protein
MWPNIYDFGIIFFSQYLQYKNYVILFQQNYLYFFVSYTSLLVFYYIC